MQKIEIQWHPRLAVAVSGEEWDYSLPALPPACRNTNCFYAIYGWHQVYGPDSLLYIGETKQAQSTRDIATRLKEHLQGRFWSITDLSISIGVPEDQQLSSEDVRLVESILIAAHTPAMNRRSIDQPIPGARDLLVQNFGFTRAILPECSGNYWLS